MKPLEFSAGKSLNFAKVGYIRTMHELLGHLGATTPRHSARRRLSPWNRRSQRPKAKPAQRRNGPPLATQLGFTKCHIETNLQIDHCPKKKRATTNNPGCSIHSLTCFLPIQGECLEMHKEKGNSLWGQVFLPDTTIINFWMYFTVFTTPSHQMLEAKHWGFGT